MRHTLITVLAATSLLSAPAFAATSAANFVKNASIGNMYEIETSRVALDKSKNEKLRNFAQEMIDDHSKAGNSLKATLLSANIAANPATTLDATHQKKLDELKKSNGADFDKKYVQIQEDAHKEAVSLFEKYADNGDNADLKDFASNTLPTLQQHKSHIDSLAK